MLQGASRRTGGAGSADSRNFIEPIRASPGTTRSLGTVRTQRHHPGWTLTPENPVRWSFPQTIAPIDSGLKLGNTFVRLISGKRFFITSQTTLR